MEHINHKNCQTTKNIFFVGFRSLFIGEKKLVFPKIWYQILRINPVNCMLPKKIYQPSKAETLGGFLQ
ncbi:MAG: hypothetical protein ACJAWV_002542 [Flammeovirgaceae bacterium]|jgi:hypothetical protein